MTQFWGCRGKLLLLNALRSFSGINSAKGIFVIEVVLPCVPAGNNI